MSEAAFQQLKALCVSGARAEAGAALTAFLSAHPDHVEAWQLRGVLALEAGDPAAAIEPLGRAIALKPDYAEAHMNLGNALADLGRVGEALPEFRTAIRLAPHLAMAHNSLGLAFQRLGQWRAAAASHQRAVDHQADYAEAWTNLGNAQRELGNLAPAIAAHRRALALRPDYAAAHVNLGTALRSAGRLDEAIAAYRAGLTRDPKLAAGYKELGMALRAAGRLDDALAALETARALAGRDPVTHYNIGVVQSDLGRLAEARDALRHSLVLDERAALSHYALGNVLRDLGSLADSVAAFRAAVRLDPGFIEAWSNLLFMLNFLPGETDSSLLRANREWAATLPQSGFPSLANDPDPQRVLRIGYVSAEFRRHHFLTEFRPVLRAHDRARFRVTCYADVAAPDRDTETVAAVADQFRNLHGLSPLEQEQAIRADGIDILVSLTGYLAKDRRLLAARLAPVQATYINHLTSTGLTSVDYRITDEWLDPPGAPSTSDPETAIRLASGFSTYAPPDDAPAPGTPPCLRNGVVTFGCFNTLLKVTDATIALWAELLHRVGDARLVVKARELSRPAVRDAFAERLRAGGIAVARCDLVGHIADPRENLAFYTTVDIGLDPVPFTGGATTREMLWMGLPVVTLAGATRAARIGSSLLRRSGMADLIAQSSTEYVLLAAELAGDRPRLAALRADQRQRLTRSALLDALRHMRELETAYRSMWERWCAQARSAAR
jgi:predicted O-linked N-acetylglucosamine transferase (SPINDLY family)